MLSRDPVPFKKPKLRCHLAETSPFARKCRQYAIEEEKKEQERGMQGNIHIVVELLKQNFSISLA
jgi:hypothetical protein